MLELFSKSGSIESINRAHLTLRNEPVYGPNNEIKEAFFT
jgi:hypothetical protein